MQLPSFVVVMSLALSACSSGATRRDSSDVLSQLNKSADSYIVAAVDNPNPAALNHAGSTPRGYDGVVGYGPSLRARQLMKAVIADYNLREVTSWPIGPLHVHCAVLEIPATADRNEILAALAHDQRIKLAQPLQTFTTRSEVYNDPYVSLQHGFQLMDVSDAHPLSRGEGVKIALIDTGVDTTHPDLRNSIATTLNFVDNDTAQFRRDIHGTEVAGVIAATANNHEGIVGVAPRAQLLAFKACWQLAPEDAIARCNSLTLAKALVAALDARVQIVNLSLAGPDDLLLHDLIQEGIRRGILFVGAAPGSNTGNGDSLLANNNVIAVATAEEPHAGNTAVYAPGREILTLLPGGHYGFASGSSLATAHVTGTVALLLAKHPALTYATVYQLLNNSTAHSTSINGEIDSVDACAAVTALLGRGTCVHPTSSYGQLPRSSEPQSGLPAISQVQ